MFDMLSGGKDVAKRDDLPPPLQRLFDRIAESGGITRGEMTRAQFLEAIKTMTANRGVGGPAGPGTPAQGGGGPGRRAGGAMGGRGGAAVVGGVARATILNPADGGAERLAATLSLDNEQKEKLKKVLADHEKKVRDAMKKQQDALLKELKPVLSEEQLKRLQEMFNQSQPNPPLPAGRRPAQPRPDDPPSDQDDPVSPPDGVDQTDGSC
jgi:hypothetical protein